MTTTTLETKVHDFLSQKRIAVAGVSRDRSHHPTGNLIYDRLKKTGHDVFAVNPHMQTFEGDRCYPDLQSIPGGVDGVVIVTRPETTQRIVRDCRDAGVRRVWMHQSFGKGTSVSPEAVEYCQSSYEAAEGADAVVIVTEWNEFKLLNLERLRQLMRRPLVFDGRNIYEPERMRRLGFEYHSIGRKPVFPA